MSTKAAIIERIGEGGLILPELITRGLAANDRLKYYLTLLQTAHAYANAPRSPAPSLRIEREASGVADGSLDQVIEASSLIGNQSLHIPASASIVVSILEALRQMLQPLRIAGATHPDVLDRFDVYQRRLDDLVVHAPPCYDDQLTVAAVSALTAVAPNGHDTVHQLALDLHWELNRLQANVAVEIIDGASVYDITRDDRALVSAFMKGIHETAHLKFDYSGLGTTATRDGDRLCLQNDLGTNDAHVLVVHVTGLLITVTYTDVHRSRVQFLHHLMSPYDVQWTAAPVGPDADFEMSVGSYTADSAETLERYLIYLGSRLVFLIDWNRARKRLARLIRKSDAIDLLKWAADNNVGHRGFVQAGGVGLIDRALERAAPGQVRLGTRLDEWLGRESARIFLMSVLRTASAGVKARHSTSLIEDEVEADLLRHLQNADPHMISGVAEHAVMLSALAERVRGTLMRLKEGDAREEALHTAELARSWSARADQIALQSRRLLERHSHAPEVGRILTEADAALDALEETAFMLTVVSDALDSKTVALLEELSDLAGDMVREYVRCLEEGRDLSPASARTDVDTFLITIDRLAELGSRAHAAKRALTERLLRERGDFHDAYAVVNMADGFGRAASSLARCGAIVRDHVLSDWLSR